jgi:hypothetical protein
VWSKGHAQRDDATAPACQRFRRRASRRQRHTNEHRRSAHGLPCLHNQALTWIRRRKNTTKRGDDQPPSHSPPGWEVATPWLAQHGHGACQPGGQAPVETDSITRGGLHLQQLPTATTLVGRKPPPWIPSAGQGDADLRRRSRPMDGEEATSNCLAPRRQAPHRGEPGTTKLYAKRTPTERMRRGSLKDFTSSDPNWPGLAACAVANKLAAG